jgi:hypothetical protein
VPALPPAFRIRIGSPLDQLVERRFYVNASPAETWTAIVADENAERLYRELIMGPAEPAWPAGGTARLARLAIGMLREPVLLESLEARPAQSFRFRVVGIDVIGEVGWALEPLAGGTRIVHTALIEPVDRWATILARLTRRSPGDRADEHLVALRSILDATAAGAAVRP